MDDPAECIRCGEAPPVEENGYCGHCYWAVRAEVHSGFCAIVEYLARWREFRDWEAEARGA